MKRQLTATGKHNLQSLLGDAIAEMSSAQLLEVLMRRPARLSSEAHKLIWLELLTRIERLEGKSSPPSTPTAASSKPRAAKPRAGKLQARVYRWQGKEQGLADLARAAGLPYSVVYFRVVRSGWELERALRP